MLPTRRDLRFKIGSESASHWHVEGAALTHFINAMSLTFPEGERYFIHTVRHFRERVRSPDLIKAVTAFIGQEAMHGREHEEYNRRLDEAGLPAAKLQAFVADFFSVLKQYLPPEAQLSTTIAQEHFTAIVAEALLTNPDLIEGADPKVAALWRWHALEEIEHKAVAYDVYEAVMGRGAGAYALRAAGMVGTTAAFLALVLGLQASLMIADRRPGGRAGLVRMARFMFVSPGLWPKLAKPWVEYFKPDFHPWQHDNRHLLQQLDEVVLQTAA
jgi:predicted metal-dependent hydrolase